MLLAPSRDCNVSVNLLVFNRLISKKALSWEFFQYLIKCFLIFMADYCCIPQFYYNPLHEKGDVNRGLRCFSDVDSSNTKNCFFLTVANKVQML